MMEPVTGLPEGTIGVRATGKVTADDYRDVLLPALDQALLDNPRIRLFFELGPDFGGYDGGALWEDTKLGLKHLSAFERVAVVTDVEWIRHAVETFRFMIPAETRVFGTADEDAARRWLTA